MGDKRIKKNQYKQFIFKLLYSLKLFWKYNEYMWIIKKNINKKLALFFTLENDATIPHV